MTSQAWPLRGLAVFEHGQIANWRDGQPPLSTFEICEKLSPIHDNLLQRAKRRELRLDQESISSFHAELASALGAQSPGQFRDPSKWSKFIESITGIGESGPGLIELENTDAWIISSLFWDHLVSLRLLASWLYVGAMHVQEGRKELPISVAKLGGLIDALTAAGPPVFDAEELRGSIRQYGDEMT